jgi:hypothetical protein
MRIQIDFNDRSFNQELKKLNEQKEILTQYLNYIELITTEWVYKPKEDVSNYISELTGFPNSKMGSEMLLMGKEFAFIQMECNSFDLSNYIIDYDKKEVLIKKDVLKALKERYTTYLKEQYSTHYTKLESIINLLNELPQSAISCIQQVGDEYKINLLKLNQQNSRY